MPTTILQAEYLTRRYGPLTAADDLSLEVRTGEILRFLGPNSAGKTTPMASLQAPAGAPPEPFFDCRAVMQLPTHAICAPVP